MKTFGIYKISFRDENGKPVAISRIGGIDESGIVYIGSSIKVVERTHEFKKILQAKGTHDGAMTFLLMWESLIQKNPIYKNYNMNTLDIKFETEEEARNQEAVLLADYFNKYSELPPCNSNIPRKWGDFINRLKQLWGWEKP
jgi:hypothetical protein